MPYTPKHSYITRYLTVKRDLEQPADASVSIALTKEPLSEVLLQAPAAALLQRGGSSTPMGAVDAEPSSATHTAINEEVQVCSYTAYNTQTQEQGIEPDIRQLIQALPTKDDIQKLLVSITGALREEMEEVRAKVVAVDDRVHNLEKLQGTSDTRLEMIEEKLQKQHQRLVMLQLQSEESENRSRRNNIRIKGVPEDIEGPALRDTVMAILNQVLKNPPNTPIELDRVHKVPTTRNPAQTNPRDVLCRVHFFRIKENILRAAWQEGTVKYEGAEIQIYPDLCRQTKIRRRILKPLLDYLLCKGATYRWGYPLAVIVKKGGRSFNLRDPAQLPDLFHFLGVEAIEVPNWTELPTLIEQPIQQLQWQRERNRRD